MESAPHQRLVLLCARSAQDEEIRFEIQKTLLGKLNWNLCLQEACRQEVAPLLYWNLRNFESSIPREYTARLARIYYNNLYRNLILSKELLHLCKTFEAHGIPFVPVKGVILGEMVYGHPGFRYLQDLDILIPRKEVIRTARLLRNNGYIGEELDKSYKFRVRHGRNITLAKTTESTFYHLDVQWKFKDSFLHLSEKEVWENLVPYNWEGQTIHVFSPELTFIHLTHHLHSHGYTLKILVDIAETLRAYENKINWDKVLEFARLSKMARNLVTALQSVDKVLNYPFPREVVPLMNSLTQRKWVSSIVSRENWYFSLFGRKIRSHGYLCTAFSGLFTDGDYSDLLQSYTNRAIFWVRGLAHQSQPETKGVHA